jgi:hypothetical protein
VHPLYTSCTRRWDGLGRAQEAVDARVSHSINRLGILSAFTFVNYTIKSKAGIGNGDIINAQITFSLAPGAPAGRSVHPGSGVLKWTPACVQGGSSNVITVIATDDGCGNLSSAGPFVVIVTECLQANVGTAYAIELMTALGAATNWQVFAPNILLTNQNQVLCFPNGGAPATFYPARAN